MAVLAVVGAVVVSAPPALGDGVRDAQWHLDFLKVGQAHRISQGAGVTVAVLDSGVDARHRDLVGAVLPGRDFAILKARVPDGRTDLDGHGTAMAGLIAGRGHGSGGGVLGIAPKAKILPVRIHSTSSAVSSSTPQAIEWAVAQGAKVISMSFGGGTDREKEEAVQAALRADVVLVAAVGNRPQVEKLQYPAAYPGVVAVGGVDRRGRHAAVSVTGRQVVLAAPAVDIMSTMPGNRYEAADGTSNATAIVAGAAALVRARFPRLSAAEVVHRLTATAVDRGARGRDEQYGFGVLDPVAALTAQVPPLPSASASPSPSAPDWPPVSPPAAAPPGPDGRRWSAGVLLVGLGCLLLAAAGAATGGWLLLRRRG
ncbi:MAG TPA: type VII secretion-associated serine protease mycosin [Pilimelia sp.]|nr:type VII secretion-associated serine protease mycosin [Pilimelia sp.]